MLAYCSAEIRMLGQKKSKIRRLERRIEKKMSKQNITEESNTRKNNGGNHFIFYVMIFIFFRARLDAKNWISDIKKK